MEKFYPDDQLDGFFFFMFKMHKKSKENINSRRSFVVYVQEF